MRYIALILFVMLLCVPSSIAKSRIPPGYSQSNLRNVVGWWKVIDWNTRVGYLDKNKRMCQTVKIINRIYYATKPYPCR